MSTLLGGMDRERRLVLACAAGRSAQPQLAELLDPQLDWTRVIQIAELNRVTGFLYSTLNQCGAAIPAAAATQFRALTAGRVLHTLKLRRELQRLLPRFADENVPVLALKGMALSPAVYPDPALRFAVDIDLLVNSDDLPNADRLLRSLGYAPAYDESRERYYEESHHHLVPYRLGKTNVQVEVHHNLAMQPEHRLPNLDDLWRRSRCVPVDGCKMRIPGPEHLVLHASMHMALAHSFSGMLRDAIDIARIIQTYADNLDWAAFAAMADLVGARRHIYYALWCSHRFARGSAPEALLKALLGKRGYSLEDRAIKFLLPRLLVNPVDNTIGRWKLEYAVRTLLTDCGAFPVKLVRALWGAPESESESTDSEPALKALG